MENKQDNKHRYPPRSPPRSPILYNRYYKDSPIGTNNTSTNNTSPTRKKEAINRLKQVMKTRKEKKRLQTEEWIKYRDPVAKANYWYNPTTEEATWIPKTGGKTKRANSKYKHTKTKNKRHK